MVRKKFLNVFNRFRFFHLNMFWYDDRYWKPFDARSEGAPIFRQKKKFGFFVQWSFERGSSVFSNLSYLRESYRFYKLKLQKAMILSDFIFENYPLWKSQLDEKNKLFFCRFSWYGAPSDRASFPEFTLHDPNDGLAIFDDLS